MSKKLFTPARFIILAYCATILFGTFLLVLPISCVNGKFDSFFTSIFHATNAVCITGVTLFDIASYYTLFGQIVIIILTQLGGLGFMTITTMMFLLLGKKISLKERLIVSESLNQSSMSSLLKTVKHIFFLSLIIEFIGALLFMIKFIPEFGFWKGSYYSIFHSISAFCNAGFDILPGNNSFNAYQGDILINFIIISLVILGGFGYIVIFDIIKKRRFSKFKIQTKLVLIISLLLILTSFISFLLIENNHALKEFNFKDKFLISLFTSVNTRTAGFYTLDVSSFSDSSRLLMIINMFIGGSSASTAGGIKITTMFVIILLFIATLKNKKEVTFGQNSIAFKGINRAVSIFILSLTMILVGTFLISVIEKTIPLGDLLFEVTSSLGTVGLSIGHINNFKTVSKIIILILMFSGRIGVLTISMIFIKNNLINNNIKYSEVKIMIG